MLLGDAILVPITEVGSVACAIGWAATCAAYFAITARSVQKTKLWERAIAGLGLFVATALVFMKIVPVVPGHFSNYEWLALAAWVLLGILAARQGNPERKDSSRGFASRRPS
jgi:hypothetical protein